MLRLKSTIGKENTKSGSKPSPSYREKSKILPLVNHKLSQNKLMLFVSIGDKDVDEKSNDGDLWHTSSPLKHE